MHRMPRPSIFGSFQMVLEKMESSHSGSAESKALLLDVCERHYLGHNAVENCVNFLKERNIL